MSHMRRKLPSGNPAPLVRSTPEWFCPNLIDTFELPVGPSFKLHRADIA